MNSSSSSLALVDVPTKNARAGSMTSSPTSASGALVTRTKPSRARTTTAAAAGAAKKLSTERSRLCRQRQKHYATTLEGSVRALQFEVADLRILRDLRREQLLSTRASASGSLARIVREYCSVFQHGIPQEVALGPTAAGSASKKRSLAVSSQLTPQAQREFMYSVMDPQVEVYDWVGRSALGCQPLLNGWEAWSLWHAALEFRVESVDVIDAPEILAVRTNGKLHVTVSERTLDELFPFAATNDALRRKLLGKQIVYALHDTFFFSDAGRVVKYTVDIDFVGGLVAVLGDYADVLALIAPPNQAPLNDLAIRAPTPVPPPPTCSRLDVQYLLS